MKAFVNSLDLDGYFSPFTGNTILEIIIIEKARWEIAHQFCE